jgi:hypothetical protein
MLQQLGATGEGLVGEDARRRLARYGSNLLKPEARSNALTILLGQFKSPIVLLLLFATALSFFLHDPVNALIILAIILASGLLGFWQERSASTAVEKLLAMVQIKATALCDGKPEDIAVEEIVPGDIVILNAGDLVPADCLVDESKDLFVDEATLTGETYPAEKSASVLAAETPLAKRTNAPTNGSVRFTVCSRRAPSPEATTFQISARFSVWRRKREQPQVSHWAVASTWTPNRHPARCAEPAYRHVCARYCARSNFAPAAILPRRLSAVAATANEAAPPSRRRTHRTSPRKSLWLASAASVPARQAMSGRSAFPLPVCRMGREFSAAPWRIPVRRSALQSLP